MEYHHSYENDEQAMHELFDALLHIKTADEMHRFFKDLCTPQEIQALSERWKVCTLLHAGALSYRQINEQTGVSLATIGRVARFLNTEPHRGYQIILNRIAQKKLEK